MKIILAEHYGLCFGVRDALRQAETLAAAGPLTVLGELVHNPLALERIHAHGARQGDLSKLDSAPPSARVLVTAPRILLLDERCRRSIRTCGRR